MRPPQASRGGADGQPLELGVAPERVEVRLVGDQGAQVGVEVQRRGQLVERLGGVVGQAPVAGEIVVEQGLVGVGPAGAFQGVDRLGEPMRPLVAPAQRDGHADVAGPERRGHFQRLQGLAISAQRAECLAGQGAGLELHGGPVGPAFEDLQRPPGQAEHQVALGLVELPYDPVADDPAHRLDVPPRFAHPRSRRDPRIGPRRPFRRPAYLKIGRPGKTRTGSRKVLDLRTDATARPVDERRAASRRRRAGDGRSGPRSEPAVGAQVAAVLGVGQEVLATGPFLGARARAPCRSGRRSPGRRRSGRPGPGRGGRSPRGSGAGPASGRGSTRRRSGRRPWPRGSRRWCRRRRRG